MLPANSKAIGASDKDKNFLLCLSVGPPTLQLKPFWHGAKSHDGFSLSLLEHIWYDSYSELTYVIASISLICKGLEERQNKKHNRLCVGKLRRSPLYHPDQN